MAQQVIAVAENCDNLMCNAHAKRVISFVLNVDAELRQKMNFSVFCVVGEKRAIADREMHHSN